MPGIIKPGSTVKLIKGGQFMTVADTVQGTKADANKVTCYWQGQNGKTCYAKFYLSELILLEDIPH